MINRQHTGQEWSTSQPRKEMHPRIALWRVGRDERAERRPFVRIDQTRSTTPRPVREPARVLGRRGREIQATFSRHASSGWGGAPLDPMEDDSPRRRRPDLGRILRGFDWPESGSG